MNTKNNLLEQLAIAETNLEIARCEADIAWNLYDEVVELRAFEMATNQDMQYSASKAENLDLVYFEAYKRVDEIKAALLELDALDAYAAELREGREAWSYARFANAANNTDGWFSPDDDENETSNAYDFAAGVFAAQLVSGL